MSTSPALEVEKDETSKQSRKRPSSRVDDGEPASKRTEDDVQFKMMIPKSVAGAVIGKGGEMIGRLQEENGIKMLVSKPHDTYPGTSERVVRLTGPISGILSVLRHILENGFVKMQESDTGRDMYDNKHHDRNKQIKLIIPHVSAGVVIGKGGEAIKEIHESSGAYLDVSKRDREPNLHERVVTFAGEHDELIKCAELLLERLATDENANSIPTVAYADIHHLSVEQQKHQGGGGPTGPGPRGDHVGMGAHAFDRELLAESRAANVQSSMAAAMNYRASVAARAEAQQQAAAAASFAARTAANSLGEVPITLVRGASNDNLLGFLVNLQATLRNMHYPNDAIVDIMGAMQTLARHNVLGLGLGFGLAAVDNYENTTLAREREQHRERERDIIEREMAAARNRREPSPQSRRPSEKDILQFLREDKEDGGKSTGWSSRSADPRVSNDDYLNGGYASRGKSDFLDLGGASGYDGGAFLKMTPKRASDDGYSLRSRGDKDGLGGGGRRSRSPGHGDQESVSSSVEVAENLIGVVLGRGGSTLIELQRYSGATMSVSRKGEGATASDLRTVSIVGTPHAVDVAKRLVERRVAEEKFQREQRLAMSAK